MEHRQINWRPQSCHSGRNDRGLRHTISEVYHTPEKTEEKIMAVKSHDFPTVDRVHRIIMHPSFQSTDTTGRNFQTTDPNIRVKLEQKQSTRKRGRESI